MPLRKPPDEIRTLADAAAFLESLIDVEKRPDLPYRRLGLARIRGLLERLGNPQRELRVLHIAGSKGKGSTALLAEALLLAAGERVGTFTSPHLESWTERFRIDGQDVEGERLAAAVASLRPHVEALRAAGGEAAPTFFDATTAAALLLFRESGVDRVILEVGLGGRLDSTNVVEPAVTCVTSIELEHTDRLGDTLARIAGEKAGILKPGVPAVLGVLPPEALEVVEARARACGAPVARLGREFRTEVLRSGLDGQRVRLADGEIDVTVDLPVLGAHQVANAALALACARRSGGLSDPQLAAAAATGLARVRLPGRIELLSRAPWVVVDGAHTAVSARALADVLARLPRRRGHLVLSVSGGKDVAAILSALLPQVGRVTVTRAEPVRSLPAEELLRAVQEAAPGLPVTGEPDPVRAIREARAALSAEDLLCVSGSVYLAGLARGALAPPARS